MTQKQLFSRFLPAVLLCSLIAALPAPAQSNAALDKVLNQMDKAAANFHTTEASFVWDQYQKVIDETESQKGKVYFRRNENETQMAAELTDPDAKFVLFTNGKVEVYQPKIDQVTTYDAGKDRAAFESFLVLGFGGS